MWKEILLIIAMGILAGVAGGIYEWSKWDDR